MSLITEPEIYSPNINEKGEYIDYIPPKNKVELGIRCPCGSRKDKIYNTQSKFSTHIKTKIHKKWLESVNNNKSNYYVENLRLKDTINSQKLTIARLEISNKQKDSTIVYLTERLTNKEIDSLIEF